MSLVPFFLFSKVAFNVADDRKWTAEKVPCEVHSKDLLTDN